jgi:hypothetical protein
MNYRKAFILVALMLALVKTGNAQGTDKNQNYFSDTADKVKATADPAQKRELLDNSLQSMSAALARVEKAGLVKKDDRAGVDRFRATLQDKQDELVGVSGFTAVPDADLNAFADYVVQDMEQAAETITISLVAALLIVIIIVLIT